MNSTQQNVYQPSPQSQGIQPAAVCCRMAGLLLVVITLTFIDCFNMKVAANYTQQEFSLSNVEIGKPPHARSLRRSAVGGSWSDMMVRRFGQP